MKNNIINYDSIYLNSVKNCHDMIKIKLVTKFQKMCGEVESTE